MFKVSEVKIGNLSKIQSMQNTLGLKVMSSQMNNEEAILTKSEVAEIKQVLRDFDYVLHNLYLYENALRRDKYGALVSVSEEMKEKDY